MTDVIHVLPSGRGLVAGGKTYRCAIGANGFSNGTFEGSRTTPLGEFALRPGFYREDRLSLPKSSLPLVSLSTQDGWCDDPVHPSYNQHVQLPFTASHEELWREHGTYDIIIPIGYNDDPVIPGKGSAIFFHCARPDYSPTLGCVAVSKEDMLELLPCFTLATRIVIG